MKIDNNVKGKKLNFKKSRSTRANIRQKALEEMWNRGGQIEHVLDANQLDMYNTFNDFDYSKAAKFTFLCSRRLGKTVLAFALCDELCRREPGVRVLFLSKTTENLQEIRDQAASVYLATCPEKLSPEWKEKKSKYIYHNGSEIRFKGMDRAGPDSIRGVKAKLVIFDEFCFMDKLLPLVKSSVGPMISVEKGRMLFISSSPDSPGHESMEIIAETELNGALIKKTVYDCPRWSEEDIDRFAAEAGGKDSDTFRREYMCEIITDRNRAILTSCTSTHMDKIVKKWNKPTDYIPDHYISIDPGGRDQTAILYAYYDYLEGTLVIDDEDIIDSASTEDIQKAISKKLKGEWKGIKPHRIIMDNNNLILVKDMQKLHGMSVKATKKDKKEAQVNNTNIMMMKEEIVIDPRCVNLDKQCRYGVWNKNRTSYERSAALSHCDAIDALVYLVRNTNRSRNPIPEFSHDPINQVDHGYYDDSKRRGSDIFKQIFKRR